jgi:hypothetical protein
MIHTINEKLMSIKEKPMQYKVINYFLVSKNISESDFNLNNFNPKLTYYFECDAKTYYAKKYHANEYCFPYELENVQFDDKTKQIIETHALYSFLEYSINKFNEIDDMEPNIEITVEICAGNYFLYKSIPPERNENIVIKFEQEIYSHNVDVYITGFEKFEKRLKLYASSESKSVPEFC